MQLIDTDHYTTTFFTFEDANGNIFYVVHNEPFDDFTPEWDVRHYGGDDEINDNTINSLIEMAQSELNK